MSNRRPAALISSGRSIGRWRGPSAPTIIPIFIVIGAFALLLPVALTSLLAAITAIALLALLAMVATLGAERSSTVMLVLAFGFAPLTSLGLGGSKLVLASGFFAIAVGLALPQLMRRKLQLPTTFVIGALLFTAAGLISAPLAINVTVSLAFVLTTVIALILIPVALVWMAPTYRQMYMLALAFGIGTAASTLIGLTHYTYRNPGFTYHPVALAYTAMLTLAFVPFLLATKVRGRWMVVPPVAAVALVGVWTSGSRTSLIVLIALVVLIPVLERSIKLGLLMVAAVVSILPTVMNAQSSRTSTTALSRLFGGGGAQNSDSTRLSTLRDGLEQVQTNPLLGNGYSTEHTYVIHNIYVQVLAAEGVIGLIGLLLIFAALVAPFRTASAPQRCLAYPALAVILAGPFQPNMADHYLGLSLGLSLVAAVGVMNVRRQPGERPGVRVRLKLPQTT